MGKILNKELLHAEIALLVAIILQIVVWKTSHYFFGSQYVIILAEIVLIGIIALFARMKNMHDRGIYRSSAVAFLGLISVGNVSSLAIVLNVLIVGSSNMTGFELLSSAIAIFLTNIIVFSLWYWEIDSPGLTRRRWSKADQDFLFIQQERKVDHPKWQPEYLDYLYLSITNAINFAPADTKPLTRNAKFLMGTQALISVFTLALVVARSVSILG